MKVAEFKRLVATIPEEFDDLPVVSNWGYECEPEEAEGIEVEDEAYAWVFDHLTEDGARHGHTTKSGERVLRLTP